MPRERNYVTHVTRPRCEVDGCWRGRWDRDEVVSNSTWRNVPHIEMLETPQSQDVVAAFATDF